MTVDRTEAIIRDALAAEAGRAVDSETVLAELRRQGGRLVRRRTPLLVVATAVAVAVAAVTAVVVPRLLNQAIVPAAAGAAAGSQNVLLTGLDLTGNADSIVLAHLGKDGTGALISLPRDSWVDVPGAGQLKLSTAYSQGGTDKLVAAVEGLTGAHVDHYATVDMRGFAQLSTAVGGVPVCLKAAAHDQYSGASFPAGPQTVQGDTALAFLRQRHGLPNGDLDRVARLRAFLGSLAHKLTGQLGDPQVVNSLIERARKDVHVDPGWDLLAFAGQLRGLHSDQVRSATIPVGDQIMQGGVAAIGVDAAQVRSSVTALLNDESPSPAGNTPGADGATCVN
ncbi:LCP family protein [Amycolatopsis pigmentata]|uniref:LCP family protein n=1 Tax=Amycolatopsis pigmentata TaxID=450801 RepID=A0ABW5G597_9PSEU